MSATFALRGWIKKREHPLANFIYSSVHAVRNSSLPMIPPIHKPMYAIHCLVKDGWRNFLRFAYFTPMFQSRLTKPAKELYLGSSMPVVLGPLDITIGDHSHIIGSTTFTGRGNGSIRPELIIGNNCGIGWGVNIAVGTKVVFGDGTRVTNGCFLAGYPGHPIDPVARRRGDPDLDSQAGDIIMEEDVWVCTGAVVNGGVRIGRGTIVASGAVVTKDLPPMVLAGGSPARVIRPLFPHENREDVVKNEAER